MWLSTADRSKSVASMNCERSGKNYALNRYGWWACISIFAAGVCPLSSAIYSSCRSIKRDRALAYCDAKNSRGGLGGVPYQYSDADIAAPKTADQPKPRIIAWTRLRSMPPAFALLLMRTAKLLSQPSFCRCANVLHGFVCMPQGRPFVDKVFFATLGLTA